ncbi:hypothetical protein SNE40_007674 [Patella caerulea]|uniref:Phosphatidylinositol-4,5-bisphosphate 4-phosphatase n=1 Tax=Patella caerulea TaxID=87958 RepID=A0AAN8K514_PATCE
MSGGEEERRPLLTNNKPDNASPPPPYTARGGISELPPNESNTGIAASVPPISPDELPPPYTPTPQGGIPMINCKVCQAMINIEGKQHLHVVKCGVCQEATPIKAAPPGKKYVRCQCNCLLICRDRAVKIACPRSNCGRIVNLGGVFPSVTVRSPGSVRATCVHCAQVFIFDVSTRSLARCPHCRNLSAVGTNYARRRAHICLILALVFIGAGIGVTMGTLEVARENGGIYVVWTGAFIIGLSMLIRACYFYTVRTSTIISET